MSSFRSTLASNLYDCLHVEKLALRPRFADHFRETFDAVFQVCERIAREKYTPFHRLVDTEEPRFDGETVILPQATHEAAGPSPNPAYCEVALALVLYCARLVDEQRTGEPAVADEARLLLEVLPPMAKSWPNEFCLEANLLATSGAWRLRLHARLPGGTVLARQLHEHDP